MQTLGNFNAVLSSAAELSLDEQETLVHILQKRIHERRRQQLIKDVEEARAEYSRGEAKPATVEEIMREIAS